MPAETGGLCLIFFFDTKVMWDARRGTQSTERSRGSRVFRGDRREHYTGRYGDENAQTKNARCSYMKCLFSLNTPRGRLLLRQMEINRNRENLSEHGDDGIGGEGEIKKISP